MALVPEDTGGRGEILLGIPEILAGNTHDAAIFFERALAVNASLPVAWLGVAVVECRKPDFEMQQIGKLFYFCQRAVENSSEADRPRLIDSFARHVLLHVLERMLREICDTRRQAAINKSMSADIVETADFTALASGIGIGLAATAGSKFTKAASAAAGFATGAATHQLVRKMVALEVLSLEAQRASIEMLMVAREFLGLIVGFARQLSVDTRIETDAKFIFRAGSKQILIEELAAVREVLLAVVSNFRERPELTSREASQLENFCSDWPVVGRFCETVSAIYPALAERVELKFIQGFAQSFHAVIKGAPECRVPLILSTGWFVTLIGACIAGESSQSVDSEMARKVPLAGAFVCLGLTALMAKKVRDIRRSEREFMAARGQDMARIASDIEVNLNSDMWREIFDRSPMYVPEFRPEHSAFGKQLNFER